MAIMGLNKVDLNLLVFLEALFEEQNLTRAAARIGIGQPSASKALDRLRSMFGDELFIRVPSGMRPTRHALEIEPGVRRALSEIRGVLLSGAAFDPGAAKGIIRIATSDIVTLTFLPNVLARLHAKAPNLDVRVRNLEKGDAFADLDMGRADFVIGVFEDPPKRFLARPLIRDRFVVIAAKNSGLTGKLSLESYLNIPHILFTLRDDAQGAVDEALAKIGQKRRVAMTVGHLLAVPALVAETGFLATISVKIAERLGPLEGCQILGPPLALEPWIQRLIWTPEADRNPILRLVLGEITGAEDAELRHGETQRPRKREGAASE